MSHTEPWVLGLSNSHNGAVCLLKGDKIVAAVQEERLLRRKRHRILGAKPSLAVSYCLSYAGIKPRDLSLVVYCTPGPMTSPLEDVTLNPQLQAALHNIPVLRISHHLAHALSAFATSGFPEAGVLVVDGIGSPEEDLSDSEKAAVKKRVIDGWETISLYSASGTDCIPLEKHLVEKGRWLSWELDRMPRFRSLGGIFSSAAWQIFGDHHEAGKVMGLAPYGRPDFPTEDFFSVVDGNIEYSDSVPARFAHIDRWPNRKTEYENLSASCQAALEDALLYLTRHLREIFPSPGLCYAGGVALNSVANERIVRESGFEKVYIIPAAEDSGPAIGAAYYGLWHLTKTNTRARLRHDAVGKRYSEEEIAKAIAGTPGIEAVPSSDVLATTVDLLADGKIVGWFQDRSELGPRSLGQRSILCDPRSPDAKAVLNSRVKHREGFRPFAPVIPLEEVRNWFELEGVDPESPYMLRICTFKKDKKDLVPGVVHVDGTGRVQTLTEEANGRFYELTKAFHEKTGVPILLNTSFNVMGEPIIETPEDALWCFLSTGIDACVLEDRIVVKSPGFKSLLDFYPYAAAPRVSEVRLLLDGADPGRDSFLAFNVITPWGRAVQIASPNVLPVLALMDGQNSGWDIVQKLAGVVPPRVDETLLLESLKKWKLASRGEALIDGIAAPNEIVDTLLKERVTAYDEKTVLRMLIRLRRNFIAGFRETPVDSQEIGQAGSRILPSHVSAGAKVTPA